MAHEAMKTRTNASTKIDTWQRTLYIVAVAQFLAGAGFSLVFPLLPLYIQALGSTTGLSVELLAGLVFSAQALTMMIASPIWGALADRLGRKLMVLRAAFGGAVLLTLMGFARSAEELVLLRALQGLITGTVAASNALVASVTPREHAGYALGVLQVALWAGVAAGPLGGGLLADTFGYRTAFLTTGGILFLSALVILFGVDDDRERTRQQAQERHLSIWQEWRHLLSTPGILLVYALRFVVRLGQSMTAPVLPLLIQSLTITGAATATGGVTGSRSLMGTLGAGWLGRVGDRVGHRTVILAGGAIVGSMLILHVWAVSVWHILILQSLIGVALGGMTPALSALLAKYTTEGEEGAAYGLDNSVVAAARTVAPMLGAGVAASYGLRAPFLLGGLVFLVFVLALASLLPRARSAQPG